MEPQFKTLEYFKTKFYQNENSSKQFLELSEQKLVELSNKVYKKQEMMLDSYKNNKDKNIKLEIYHKTIQYITSSNIHFELKTFDEKIAFLIMMTDPNLIMFQEFLKIDLMSIKEILKINDEEERQKQIQKRNQTITSYQNKVREQIGFFDSKLLKYENLFFQRFYGEKILITEVANNQHINLTNKEINFNKITEKRYDELVETKEKWLSLVKQKYNYKTAIYSIMHQPKLLSIKNIEEQITLFILLVDPNLDMLRIYEEESLMKNIEERIIEQFGFFNIDMLKLEKNFHNRFCPEKKLSIWTKTKKR